MARSTYYILQYLPTSCSVIGVDLDCTSSQTVRVGRGAFTIISFKIHENALAAEKCLICVLLSLIVLGLSHRLEGD